MLITLLLLAQATAPASTPSAPAKAAGAKKPPMVCQAEADIGSRLTHKVCRPAHDLTADERQQIERAQRDLGGVRPMP